MRIACGPVSDQGSGLEESLPDGAEVEDRDEVEVTDAEWAALMEAADSVQQGKTVDAQTVLAALVRRR